MESPSGSVPETVPEAAASPAETSGLPDVLTVIHQRKSVRSYTGEPVGLPELRELVRAGFAAPTARGDGPKCNKSRVRGKDW